MQKLRCWDFRLAVAILVTLATPALSRAADSLPDLNACQPVATCLQILDHIAPAQDMGALPPGAKVAAKQLSRFGDSAKSELLKRAQGRRPGWRNLAGAILAYWPNWSDQDVPALSAALALNHGGWIARALVALGDDRAIDALVADLPDAGAESQTGFALTQLAPKSLNRLLPLLEFDTEDPRAAEALGVITNSRDRARPLTPVWAAIASDKARPLERRLAALRALRAVGSSAFDAGEALRPLLTDPTPSIAAEARQTLSALGDRSVADEALSGCVPSDQRFLEPDMPEGSYCLLKLAAFRDSLDVIGPRLIAFATSRNGAEAALAIDVISQLGYRAAEPRLIAALGSPDWRVAYAAAAALGVFGSSDSLPALYRISREHWLPEVRTQAQQSLDAVKTGAPLYPKTTWSLLHDSVIDIVPEKEANYRCGTWEWRGQSLHTPASYLRSVRVAGGALTAVDNGEWGGGLEWTPLSGPPRSILKVNVSALEPIEGGVLALAGLAHMSSNYGYVVRARLTGKDWDLQEVARLPGRFSNLSEVTQGTYAAWSARRVVLFSERGILGLAECKR